MAMSLEIWCHKNGKDDLLEEWDYEKNKSRGLAYTPSSIEYNRNFKIAWKCEKNHEWTRSVVARTLFNRGCPICNPDNFYLPVGKKYGCLKIVGGFDEYRKEIAEKKIIQLEKDKHNFLCGKRNPNSNIDSVDFYDRMIKEYKAKEYYKCECKCGKIHYMDETQFLQTKHRYCTRKIYKNDFKFEKTLDENVCGLIRKREEKLLSSYERIKDDSYYIDYSNTIHESLEVLECIDDNYEELSGYTDKRKKGGGHYKVYKKYKCRCYLCGKEQEIKSSDLSINPPTAYGPTAYNGYYSRAYCACHKISSFQWIVTKLLKENNVNYRVEVLFEGLYGIEHTNLLRFDFAVFNDDNSIKYLIECQGEQHFKPVDEFGGEKQLEIQKRNDELKRTYTKARNIPLIEIPYTVKSYEKINKIFRLNKII